jgi:hypothetical protein
VDLTEGRGLFLLNSVTLLNFYGSWSKPKIIKWAACLLTGGT